MELIDSIHHCLLAQCRIHRCHHLHPACHTSCQHTHALHTPHCAPHAFAAATCLATAAHTLHTPSMCPPFCTRITKLMYKYWHRQRGSKCKTSKCKSTMGNMYKRPLTGRSSHVLLSASQHRCSRRWRASTAPSCRPPDAHAMIHFVTFKSTKSRLHIAHAQQANILQMHNTILEKTGQVQRGETEETVSKFSASGCATIPIAFRPIPVTPHVTPQTSPKTPPKKQPKTQPQEQPKTHKDVTANTPPSSCSATSSLTHAKHAVPSR